MQDSNSAQRVKVYRLNNEGLWDDKGTGHISVEYLEQSDSVGLVVISEEDTRPLLIHRILTKEDIYQRQSDDTIITWTDAEIGTDIALSFAEVVGCNYIWEQIQRVQDNSIRQPDSPGRQRIVDEFDGGGIDDFPEVGPARPVELPPAELASLPELAKALSEVSFMQRESLALQLVREGYVRKVMELFRQCEDLEDRDSLQQLYYVVKGMIMLGETQLLENLLEEEHIMSVIGALEYEPGLASQPKHREFLRQHVVFKEVVPIADPGVRQRIHASYQMGYIKDVVLPRSLDDQTFAALSSLMLFYNHDVLMALQTDPKFFPELFQQLRTVPREAAQWGDLVRFLQELAAQAKHLQPGNRQQLLTRLMSLGLFEVISKVMVGQDESLQYKATDILLSSVHHDPSALRGYMLDASGQQLFGQLIQLLVTSREAGLQEQILEMLRILLDPDSMDQTPEKDKFLELFYDEHMAQLVGALSGHAPPPGQPAVQQAGQQQPAGKQVEVTARTLGLVVELLCFCVQHHGYRIKYYTLRNNVVEKVLKLLRRRERWLVVAAVRFLRTCIGLKDDFYNRYITRNSLFEPVFAVFFDNGDRYNLLNSAVLDLVDFIRRENLKNLITHIVDNYYSRLEDIDYVETFKQLKFKYEQNLERDKGAGAPGPANGLQHGASGESGPGSGAAAGADGARGGPAGVSAGHGSGGRGAVPREERVLDRDEEDYFNEGGEEEEAGAQVPPVPAQEPLLANGALAGPLSGLPRLVDYDDDDDDGDELAFSGGKHASEGAGSPSSAKRPRTDGLSEADKQGQTGKIMMSIKSRGPMSARR